MSEDKSAVRVAAGMSTAAAIAAALAWLNSKKVGAEGEFTLPEEFVQLIANIAASSDTIDFNVQKILEELAGAGITVQGYPSNAPRIRSFAIACLVANQAYQGNDLIVPEGMVLLIKSYPTNIAGSLVHVASSISDATNPNSSYPLMPNDVIGYAVQNADQMWVSATVAGSIVTFSAESKG